MNHTNTLCGQNSEFSTLKLVVYVEPLASKGNTYTLYVSPLHYFSINFLIYIKCDPKALLSIPGHIHQRSGVFRLGGVVWIPGRGKLRFTLSTVYPFLKLSPNSLTITNKSREILRCNPYPLPLATRYQRQFCAFKLVGTCRRRII
jgi:hypothetical protein